MITIYGISVSDMCRIIYFNNDNQKKDYCSNQTYYDFLEYAFAEATYFMLVYVNYYGRGYSAKMKKFRSALKPFEIKSRSSPHWPGVNCTFCVDTTYKVVFYRTSSSALEVLKEVKCVSDWTAPLYPQDLAFFKGNKCWFYSVGHEKIAAIICPSKKDLDFLEINGLADREAVFVCEDGYYDAYNEKIEES